MRPGCRALLTPTLIALCGVLIALPAAVTAQGVKPLCNPKIVADKEVATPAQRKAAGEPNQEDLPTSSWLKDYIFVTKNAMSRVTGQCDDRPGFLGRVS